MSNAQITVNGQGYKGIAWWDQDAKSAAPAIQSNLLFWHQRQIWRMRNYLVNAKIYGNLPSAGVYSASVSRITYQENAPTWDSRLTFNVVQSCVDSLVAKIASNEPTPDFVTSDGDYKAQRQAEMLDKFCAGLFYECKTYQKTIKAFKTALIQGEGVIKVCARDKKVCHEVVSPDQLWVDELEASINSGPRQIHHVYDIDRSVLMQRYPDKEREIQGAGRMAIGLHFVDPTAADIVTVIESWHLPSHEDADDGKYMVSTTEGPLTEMEDWKHQHFPFVRMKFSERPYGYFPQGLVEQLKPIQTEINRILWSIQCSMMMAGTFKIWAKNGAKIVIDHLDDRIGTVLKSDEPPEYIVPQIVPPELYTQLNQLKQDAYNQSGVSQLSATSQKPADISSGVGLRTYEDINTARFLPVGKAYETLHIDIARLSILTVQDIGAKNYKVKSPSRNSLDIIDFSEIELDHSDDYDIQCFPISNLPNEPAGRLSTVQEMMQANLIDPEEGRDLLNFPDLARSNMLHASLRKFITKSLDDMIDTGEYMAPEVFDDLSTGHKLALEYYARGKLQQLPEDRLDLLRRYISDIATIQQAAMPPPMPGAPGPGGAPALPSAPPVSNLLPNAPPQ